MLVGSIRLLNQRFDLERGVLMSMNQFCVCTILAGWTAWGQLTESLAKLSSHFRPLSSLRHFELWPLIINPCKRLVHMQVQNSLSSFVFFTKHYRRNHTAFNNHFDVHTAKRRLFLQSNRLVSNITHCFHLVAR